MSYLDSLLDRIEEKEKMEGQIQLSTNATSLDFLQAIYRDPTQPLNTRMRAAQAALPFEHPKLGVTVQVSGGDLAERLMYALQATNKVINARPMQVIEASPVAAGKPIDEVLDHSKPFAQRRRF